MSRLPKSGAVHQRELFARADLPALVPTLGYYAALDRRRSGPTATPAPIYWQGLGSWVRQVQAAPRERLARVARLLDVAKVRSSRDQDGLERVAELLADHRNNDLGRAFTRAQLGELLVEARNRLVQLQLGRDTPRAKGPRLDPARLPLEALERLIQRHPDLQLVDELRAELRSRRG